MSLLTAMLVVFGGAFIAPNAAHAAEVQPTITNGKFTDANGNPVTSVQTGVPYKVSFDFALPAGATAGDTFVVTMPENFTGQGTTSLGGGSTAVAQGNTLVFTLGSELAGQENINGYFEAVVYYTHPAGTAETPVQVDITVGNEKVYSEELPGSGPPPGPPMAINKWSGYSTAKTNVDTATASKLQNPAYDYDWQYAVEGQVFASWFIQLNNYQSSDAPQDIGQNIVVSDSIAGLPEGFEPKILRGATKDQATDATASLLNGSYLNKSFSVVVRDGGTETTYPSLGDTGQTEPFVSFSSDGSSFTFRVSEYLESLGVTPSNSAQYSINYKSVVPAVRANVTNDASVTTDVIKEPATDTGWYRTVESNGWIYGEQPLTSLSVNKVWEGVDPANAPAVEFTLLADGEPAKYLNGTEVPNATIEPGSISYTWQNLPTQSSAGVPIEYSVVETPLPGYESSVGSTYTPNLTDLANIPAGEITVTNTKVTSEEPIPGPTPTPEPKPEPGPTPAPEPIPIPVEPSTEQKPQAPEQLAHTGSDSSPLYGFAMLSLMAGLGLMVTQHVRRAKSDT